jgi:uncharacterized protein YecE (DUF72 family)
MARTLIGTSGWHYDSWRGPFFPTGLPLKHQLQYYAGQFQTTELNGVFYRTPTYDAVKSWRAQTGKNFVFAWKASKFITHWKRLSHNSVNSLELLEERLSLLGNKAGPILFQLPPNFEVDADRLVSFFELLSKTRRYSFEFRHPKLVPAPHYETAVQAEYLALPVGSPRCPRAMEAHCRLRLYPGPRPRGSLQGALSSRHARGMGAAHQVLEAARIRRIYLFRQRSKECRAGRCNEAASAACVN